MSSTETGYRFSPDAKYYVVHDVPGGAGGDGMIAAGPFRRPSAAIKEKNRRSRENPLCEYRIQEVPLDDE